MLTRVEYFALRDKLASRQKINQEELRAMNRYAKVHFRRKGNKKSLVSAPKKSSTKKKKVIHKLLDDLSDEDISPAFKKRLSERKKNTPKKTLSDRLFDNLSDDDITSADEDSWGTRQGNTHYTNLLIKHYFSTLLNIDTGAWDVAYIDPAKYDENMWTNYIRWVKRVRPKKYNIEMGFYYVAKRIQREFKELESLNTWLSPHNPEFAFWQRKSEGLWRKIQNYYDNNDGPQDWN